MTYLGDIVRSAGARFGPRPLLEQHGRRLRYDELDTRSDAVARGLRESGVGPGDVVAITLPSSADYLVVYAAAAKVGAVTAGVNPKLAAREIDAVLGTAQPALTVSDVEQLRNLERAGPPPALLHHDPDRPVAIVFTSGTTGRPKGALFTERQLQAISALDTGHAVGDPDTDPVPMLASTQFAHIGTMTKFPWYLRTGATIHALDKWDSADALATIAEHRIPGIGAIAPMIGMMLALPDFDDYDLECVKTMIVGGAPSPPSLIREARERFRAVYSNRYSSTESGGCGTAVPFDSVDEEEIVHTAGPPRGPVEVEVRDDDGNVLQSGEVGEIWLRSPTQFVRYWNNPEATSATIVDGWVRTGDLGSIDDAGRLRPTGRTREAYIRGGYNVWPAEVERQIGEHPAVAEVVVVPRSDERLGQVGVAVITTASGAAAPDVAELQRFLRDRLARYKQPEDVVVVDALPRTAMEKYDRSALERMVERGDS